MSRSPLAREVLREKISKSPSSASAGFLQEESRKHMINVLSMVTMTFADKLGYVPYTFSPSLTLPDLAQADLIIPLDHEKRRFHESTVPQSEERYDLSVYFFLLVAHLIWTTPMTVQKILMQ